MIAFSRLQTKTSHVKDLYSVLCNKRSCSSTKADSNASLHVYSSEQQLQVIDTLRKSALNNTTRVHLSEKRLQSLKIFFEQTPNMKSLEPLLTVEGLGPRLLQKICDSILFDQSSIESENEAENVTKNNVKPVRVSSSLLTPSKVTQKEVQSIVSIHLGINAISWARLQVTRDSQLDSWDFLDLSRVVDKKYDVHSTWDLAMHLRDAVPDGDVYVMEGCNWSNVANIKKPLKYHIQQAMLTSTICSLINQSDCERQPRLENNRLYFLRPYTPSRLFRKIVGSERVSAQDVVQNMIDGTADQEHRRVEFHPRTTERYRALPGSLKDTMCQALLLVVSFTELAITRNPRALSVVGKPTGKRKTS